MATAPSLPLAGERSARWKILDAIQSALKNAPELAAINPAFHVNPVDGIRVERDRFAVVVRWDQDRLMQRVAIDQRRSFRLMVGAVANTSQAPEDADVVAQAMTSVIQRLMPTLNGLTGLTEVSIEEESVDPVIEDTPVDGALVVTTLNVTYRQRARRLAGAAPVPPAPPPPAPAPAPEPEPEP